MKKRTLILIILISLSFVQPKIKYGIASYYANKFEGRQTANGEIYRGAKYTAASNTLKFDTWVRVTNLKNDSVVIVRINDRMARHNKRLIDLSKVAGKQLNFDGLTKVSVEIL